VDRLAETKAQLIRRFSAQCVIAEQIEAQLASGNKIDVEQHCQISSTLTRLAQRIGISRVPKEVPTLQEYIRQREAELAEADQQIEEESDGSSDPAQ
jgi:hypothetical protein